MSNKQFISNLSSSYADVRKLDAKKINLRGKDILDVIAEHKTVLDERGTLANAELDIWSSNVTTDEDGNVIVRESPQKFEISIDDITDTQLSVLQEVIKVENNRVLGDNDEHLMFFKTNGLTNGSNMFSSTLLTSFNSDLSNLIDGSSMFENCAELASFNSDLSSLTSGICMFSSCTSLTSFSNDLNNLTDGSGMFAYCENLTSFNGDLSSLITHCAQMFGECYNLTSFNGDLSNLIDGSSMFENCTSLTSFSSDLSSLISGDQMFSSCKLDAPSLANIIHTLPDTGGFISIGLGIDDTDEARQAIAEAIWCKDWNEVNQEFANKNWTVTWQYNGAPTA